ncbi:MAG: SMC-Scp complex subunit ScpB [Coriobacteriales bacterium]|jgi:segregation and condensation protein B|nr:SMC-Scp complex subunit ScpB [Coriobacteriales bacterium]
MSKQKQKDDAKLAQTLEAMLFVSDEPVSAARLADLLERKPSEVDAALGQLAGDLEEREAGVQLLEVAGGWRLYTHPATHEAVEKYVLSWDTRTLSQAALETLAVVAYHQPCTRNTVSGVRGVSSDGVLSSLIDKGLVKEVGHSKDAGNALLYGTTRGFLEKFGLKGVGDLPPLEDFAPDEESRELISARLSVGESSEELSDDDLAALEEQAAELTEASEKA